MAAVTPPCPETAAGSDPAFARDNDQPVRLKRGASNRRGLGTK
jgi:hypothetical protein